MSKTHDKVTEMIISLLEEHQELNYTQSWIKLGNGNEVAKNAHTGHVYSGLNQLLLSFKRGRMGYTSNRWLTFKQINEYDARIQKGTKASIIVFSSRLYFDKKTNKNITKQVEQLLRQKKSVEHLDFRIVPYLREYSVFNVDQVDGLPKQFHDYEEKAKLTEPEKDARAERLINQTEAEIIYRAQDRAYYSIKEDKIYLPERRQFIGKEPFYSTTFHELGHWTGAEKRMNRAIKNPFGTKAYAMEELVAELFSAFLSAQLGFEKEITNNAAYIKSWLNELNDDKSFIIKAATAAQRATDYVRKTEKAKHYQSA